MSAIPKDLIAITQPLRQVARRRRFLHSATGLLQLLIVALTLVLAAAVVAGSFSTLRTSGRWAFSIFVELVLVISLFTFMAPLFRRHRLNAIAREVEGAD